MPAPLLNRLLYRHRLLNSNPDEHTPAPQVAPEPPQEAPKALPPGDTQEPPATVVTVEVPPQGETPASQGEAQEARDTAEHAVEIARENEQEINEVKEWQTKMEASVTMLAENTQAALTSLTAMMSEMASNLSLVMEALTATELPTAPETPPPQSGAEEVAPEKKEAPEAPPAATQERNNEKKSAKSQRSWL